MNRGVRMELVILMMVMLLTTLILMMGVMMVVMMEMVEMMVMIVEMMVVMVMEMEEMVEVMVMTTMPHCWLRGGPHRSTMICRVMPTTTQSFSTCTPLPHQVHHTIPDRALDPP